MLKAVGIIKKRVRGDSSFIATMLSLFVVIVVFMGFVYSYIGIMRTNDVERVQRKYILAMEREGYLSAANRYNLETELINIGCDPTRIVISGSLSPVGYGNTVTLKIDCYLEVKSIVISGDNAVAERRYRHVVKEQRGTALYKN